MPRPGREPTTSRTLHNKQGVPHPTRSAISGQTDTRRVHGFIYVIYRHGERAELDRCVNKETYNTCTLNCRHGKWAPLRGGLLETGSCDMVSCGVAIKELV